MTALDFFLVCDPPKTSHHAKRIVKRGPFASIADKPELTAAKTSLESLLLPYQPLEPITGPVALTVTYCWPWLKGHTKRERATGKVRHTSRPDCSNLVKTLEDCLVRLRFIEDDNAVAVLRVEKWWGDAPGIGVRIESLAGMSVDQAQRLFALPDVETVTQ
jgi:Holliday junction resolvase RusA-like endonuclease